MFNINFWVWNMNHSILIGWSQTCWPHTVTLIAHKLDMRETMVMWKREIGIESLNFVNHVRPLRLWRSWKGEKSWQPWYCGRSIHVFSEVCWWSKKNGGSKGRRQNKFKENYFCTPFREFDLIDVISKWCDKKSER